MERSGATDASGTIDKALEVLFHLHEQPASRGVSELGRALALPKSTAHRLLASLSKRGLVERVDLVLDQRRLKRTEGFRIETFRQVEAVNLGAEMASDALDLERCAAMLSVDAAGRWNWHVEIHRFLPG